MRIVRRWLSGIACPALGFGMILAGLSTSAWAVPSIPEIDPGSMGSALTLLFAGTMLLSRRFRKS